MTYSEAVPNQRGYNNSAGSHQHYSSSPQQGHQFGPHHQQRSGSNSGYSNKNYVAQGQHQQATPQSHTPVQSGQQRSPDAPEEAK